FAFAAEFGQAVPHGNPGFLVKVVSKKPVTRVAQAQLINSGRELFVKLIEIMRRFWHSLHSSVVSFLKLFLETQDFRYLEIGYKYSEFITENHQKKFRMRCRHAPVFRKQF